MSLFGEIRFSAHCCIRLLYSYCLLSSFPKSFLIFAKGFCLSLFTQSLELYILHLCSLRELLHLTPNLPLEIAVITCGLPPFSIRPLNDACPPSPIFEQGSTLDVANRQVTSSVYLYLFVVKNLDWDKSILPLHLL